ncbi:MAG: hypothetical protein VKM01_09385 [Cyanobacteriota bacterium]|nr:hypothetical protein [Cyanobacteriota bacterium]
MLDDLLLDQPMPFRGPDGAELLDLHELLVPRPLGTFFMRVSGDGMRGHGVVVVHGGEFLLRPLGRDGSGQWFLAPLGPGETAIPVEIDDIHDSPFFGVAVHGIHRLGPSAARRR